MKTVLITIFLFLFFANSAVAFERSQFELSIPPAYDTEEYKDDSNQFYISKPKNAVIDFSSKLVGTMGVAGISSHPTPSGRTIVVLAPEMNTNILGVTLDFTVKTQVREPVFKGEKVSYEW